MFAFPSHSTKTQSLTITILVQHDFVLVIRAVELILGITPPGKPPYNSNTTSVAQAFTNAAASADFTPNVRAALQRAVPILAELSKQLPEPALVTFDPESNANRSPLFTT